MLGGGGGGGGGGEERVLSFWNTNSWEEKGGGGGGGGTDFGKRSLPIPNMGWGMRRESAELWNTNSWGGQVGGWEGGGAPTLEKEEGFQFQTSQGMNGKTGVPGRKPKNNNNQLVGCSGNSMILILMRVSLPSKLRKTKQPPPPPLPPQKKRKKKKKRRKEETELHTLTYALTHTHTCIHALLQFYRRLQ